MVKRQYIFVGSGIAALSIALIISRPYLVMLLEFAQMKQYVGVDHQAGLPDQLFDINDDVITNEISTAIANYKSQPHADRNAYFGDLHVHTALSFDAYALAQQPHRRTPIASLRQKR